MKRKNYCYIHACNINNGLSILKELLDRITDNSLDTVLEKIRICILGETNKDLINNIENYHSKIEVIYTNKNIKLYEYPTLKLIYDFCQKIQDCNILYIHTKGATKPTNKGEIRWREYMSYFMIDKYQKCLNILEEGYDSAGCELKTGSNKFKYLHYAGNFWWAKSEYIGRQLPDPQIFVTHNFFFRESKIYRFHAEEWIMMSNQIKPFNLFGTYRNLLKYPIKLMEYLDGDKPSLNYLHVLRNSNIIDQEQYESLLLRNKKKYLLKEESMDKDNNAETDK